MGHKILVVNDDGFQLMFCSAQFMEAGFEVLEAEDGQQACEKFEADSGIDVVVMDINMPVMGGLEACDRMSQIQKQRAGKKALLFAMSADDGPEMVNAVS